MKAKSIVTGIAVITCAALLSFIPNGTVTAQSAKPYDIKAMYDESVPEPPRITPASAGTAPSDAIVLFDGKDLSQWIDSKGNPTKWKVGNGYMESVKGAGQILTKQNFGSCQLHVEWAAPLNVVGKSQGRGNSGVFLMGIYEIQVLDSYNNKTYPAGMAASIYAQNPPLVNASRPPGEWQIYDIVFHRPVFKDDRLVKPATVTVFQNGVLVQDHFEIQGATEFKKVPAYKPHGDKLPIGLQDHNNPVRFRNIWVRPLTP